MDWLFAIRFRAIVVALAAVVVCGCRGSTTAMSNPFLAPDRVPPPSTRIIAPGTAQPYYPGDPLPTMQGAAPPGAPPVANAPPTTPPAPAAVEGGAPSTQPPSTPSLAFSNERTVTIPEDNADLRFLLPEPASPPPPPAPIANAASAATTLTATQPAPSAAPAAVPAAVSPAVFNEPSAAPIAPIGVDEPPATGMWRSPQIRQDPAAVPAAANMPAAVPTPPPALPQNAAQPAIVNSNPMPVQLRAVTPPPAQQVLQPTYNPPPRIRFPNFFGTQPAVATMPAPALPPTASEPAIGSPDGFRPRGSTR